MNQYCCPFCNKVVDLKKYGHGWVGFCCDRIVYNDSEHFRVRQQKTPVSKFDLPVVQANTPRLA